MSGAIETILVEVSPGETRAASVDSDGRLVALQVERLGEESQIGAICRGRVIRVDKATQTAFVDVGLSEPALINRAQKLHEGQVLTVQVARDPWGGKGPVVTPNLSFTGRYLVLRPKESGIRWPRGMSARNRRDYEEAVVEIARIDEGLTIRSNIDRAEEAWFVAEVDRLRALAQDVEKRAQEAGKPAVLVPPPALPDRVLRDEAPDGDIVVDDRRLVAAMVKIAPQTAPDLADRIALHDARKPLFDMAEIDGQVEDALSRTVELPRGGNLVFDELEALTAIDVNTSGAGGGRMSDEAILSLNRRAAEEAVRQVILRNIAGLIVIDFVSMRNKGHRRQLVESVRRAFADDRVTVDVLGMTPAGLVEVTRQRRGRSLADMMCVPVSRDPDVQPAAIACAALRAALRGLGGGQPVLRCHPEVALLLRGRLADALAETERRLGQMLELREDAARHEFEFLWERRT